jgi:hypothetical protein
VCTGHCTVQCPVHRQPRAKIPFSCALSGVHRTGTVDCPVRPYRVLKNGLQPETEPEALFSSMLSILWELLPSPATTSSSPAICSPAVLRRSSVNPRARASLVCTLVFSSLFSLHIHPVKLPLFPPFPQNSNLCKFL